MVTNMKIEKVNDHQIRCTLTKEDLADRQLKLSELAYGTQKAKDLFRDMMQQANLKFGFEAEDIPLMIEAIPLSGDTIVLIITKVEDPEELDTRFSKFAPSVSDSEDHSDLLSELPEGADEILDLFKKVQNSHLSKAVEELSRQTAEPEKETANEEEPEQEQEITKMFSFSSLNPLLHLSEVLQSFYQGNNSLYKNTGNNLYYLVVSQSGHLPEDFNRLCNILSEHGKMERYSKAQEAHMQEHYKILIPDCAISSLAIMNRESKVQ